MLEIAKHHRVSVRQMQAHEELFHAISAVLVSWCSAFLLEEKYTLEAINLKESDNGYSSLVSIRNTWLEFCKSCNIPVPTSNPVMIAVSSSLYAYLLNHVSAFRNPLTEHTEALVVPVMVYCFGGAALCAMLKNRYKEIKKCPSSVSLWKFLCFRP